MAASTLAPLDFAKAAAIVHVHERMQSGAIPAGEIVAAGDLPVGGRLAEAVALTASVVADFKRQHTGPSAVSPAQALPVQGAWARRIAGVAQAVERYLPTTEVHERVDVRVQHAKGDTIYPVDVTDPVATNVARQAAQTTLFAGAAPFVGPGALFAGAAMCWKRAKDEPDASTRAGLRRAATKLGVVSVLRLVPVTEPLCLLLGSSELSAKRALHQRSSYTADGA